MSVKSYKPNDSARIEAMLIEQTTSLAEIEAFGGDAVYFQKGSFQMMVKTLEGNVELPVGHYLIRGTNGEFYPCDPDVFEKRWVEGLYDCACGIEAYLFIQAMGVDLPPDDYCVTESRNQFEMWCRNRNQYNFDQLLNLATSLGYMVPAPEFIKKT
jgi:hypothetical protein